MWVVFSMNGEEKSEKPIEEKLKDLERQVERLEEIKYKYYCFGLIYFMVISFIYFMSPLNIFNIGSETFNESMNFIFFVSIIFFAVIFIGELVYKFFGLFFKSKKT